MVLRAAIKLAHRSADVVDDGQLGVGIANAQHSVDGSVGDDRPVHITSRTVDADVVQGGETLAAEKIDCAQIENELMRHAGMPLDEMSERLAIRGVNVA